MWESVLMIVLPGALIAVVVAVLTWIMTRDGPAPEDEDPRNREF